ncbi:MAG: type II toxin-antitoxin system VapC family toxin [Anaerolineae bacterium]
MTYVAVFDTNILFSGLGWHGAPYQCVVDRAMELTQKHRLRGYDAVQLAAALDVQATVRAAGPFTMTFLTADEDLSAAALAEGLTADNPNHHS